MGTESHDPKRVLQIVVGCVTVKQIIGRVFLLRKHAYILSKQPHVDNSKEYPRFNMKRVSVNVDGKSLECKD